MGTDATDASLTDPSATGDTDPADLAGTDGGTATEFGTDDNGFASDSGLDAESPSFAFDDPNPSSGGFQDFAPPDDFTDNAGADDMSMEFES